MPGNDFELSLRQPQRQLPRGASGIPFQSSAGSKYFDSRRPCPA